MEAAKDFVAKFTSKRGHKTRVEEKINPAVTIETVKPTRHEITTEAVQREVHQHHYHTTVQPISHREVLPTKHTHNLIPVAHHDHSHKTKDLNEKVHNNFQTELALFKNVSTTLPTTHSISTQPAVVGEHVHHHVHEIVQPIIFKETITPEVVHTTIPIHEVHHNEPIHHAMSELSMLKMEDFNSRWKSGHTIGTELHDGPPRTYNSKFTVDPAKYRHKPAAINTSAKRHAISTPPLSPASAASSISSPSTPRNRNIVEPGFRNSEDSMNGFDLSDMSDNTSPKKVTQIHAARPLRTEI